ncbi:RNA dependent RNA polymerase [Plasmopara viticola lesion associated ourmia-like virus 43]|uniref:RNA dependent RNA polymerase n=1 Tax=Plasmopara viticola lesion associated ourmia-like virus 43 TaxID=2686513 RepID=A0ABX6FIW1_9VIRU|nr:RNA dependent RNA polymerase [Plasmopara viticola lesion associated ourmia-like virus 43]QGY72573.1 RNA dependent RNA polymerase [Plasmopara viticola lesion associated ourmia-like virus 43]
MSDECFLAAACYEPLRVYRTSRCVCSKTAYDTKMAVRAGLRVVRIRYGIPYSELPDTVENSLESYLLYLLSQGKVRATVCFPRRQSPPDGEGLRSLVRLGRKERWEFAHTVNSFKRNLPTGCRLHTPSKRPLWEKVVFSKPPPTSPEYLRFVKAEVSRIFRPGWDRRYYDNVNSFVPRASAREIPSDKSASRADLIWKGRQEEFIRRCTVEGQCYTDLDCRYKEVLSAGKVRPLTIFSSKMDVLGPLHTTLYDYLSEKPWLLRGSPTAERMRNICVNRVQTSVDLVNATDGLRHDVAEEILDSLFFSSISVPRSIRLLAKETLRPVVDGARKVTHGQMMGAYLSFPLLCLQSYLAARWAARFDSKATFLVNGDDTVISASREVLDEDYPDFFELNAKKTIRAENTVEINSTVFLREGGRWREVRHLRRGTALPGYLGTLHLARACAPSARWSDAFVKSRIGRKWGFLPSQLGLHRSSRAVWRREVSMRKSRFYTDLPCPDVVRDEAIDLIRGYDPDPDETRALQAHMFAHGRTVACREIYSPSIGTVRRSYRYRLSPPWKSLSFNGFRLGRDLPVLSCVPVLREYESDRYKGSLLSLEAFRSRCGL